MSALAIQPVQAAPGGVAPNPTGGGGGFDALLAALGSSETPTPAAGPAAQTVPTGLEGGLIEPGSLDALIEAPADLLPEPEVSEDAPVAADLAPGTPPIAVPPPLAAPPVTLSTSEATAPPAWGRDKTMGQPAAPALAHVSPHAAFLRTDETPPPTDVEAAPPSLAPTPLPTDPQRPATPATPPPPAAPQPAEPAASAAPPVEAAAPTTPDPATPATPASTAAAAALAAPARIEPAPRPAKADRARDPDTAETAPVGEGRRVAETPTGPRPVRPAQTAAQPGAEPPRLETAATSTDAEAPSAATSFETAALDAASTPAAPTSNPVRGAPETVANLAAHILKKLDARSTRFDVELDPAGLGKVDVRIEIGAQGRMTASMVFDNPQAAQDLKSRSGELRQALEQAGFDLSGGLSFDVAQDGGGRGQAWQDARDQAPSFRGEAFRSALDRARDADDLALASGPLNLRRGVTAGLDLRI